MGNFDDLRLGTEITDVVNIFAISEPSTCAVLAGATVLALGALRRHRA